MLYENQPRPSIPIETDYAVVLHHEADVHTGCSPDWCEYAGRDLSAPIRAEIDTDYRDDTRSSDVRWAS
jgi:hypothetical protein